MRTKPEERPVAAAPTAPRSRTVTRAPRRARWKARLAPWTPAPTMMTSADACIAAFWTPARRHADRGWTRWRYRSGDGGPGPRPTPRRDAAPCHHGQPRMSHATACPHTASQARGAARSVAMLVAALLFGCASPAPDPSPRHRRRRTPARSAPRSRRTGCAPGLAMLADVTDASNGLPLDRITGLRRRRRRGRDVPASVGLDGQRRRLHGADLHRRRRIESRGRRANVSAPTTSGP